MIVAYGIRPSGRHGQRFVRSFHTWSALWDFCYERHSDVLDEIEVDEDDGLAKIVYEEVAGALGRRLIVDWRDGVVADYVASRDILLNAIPSERCEFCEGTGIRTDEVGQDLMMEDLELCLEQALRLGRTNGWCNNCFGEGTTQTWERMCSLEVKDIKRFAGFLMQSGGCRIY